MAEKKQKTMNEIFGGMLDGSELAPETPKKDEPKKDEPKKEDAYQSFVKKMTFLYDLTEEEKEIGYGQISGLGYQYYKNKKKVGEYWDDLNDLKALGNWNRRQQEEGLDSRPVRGVVMDNDMVLTCRGDRRIGAKVGEIVRVFGSVRNGFCNFSCRPLKKKRSEESETENQES